MYGYIRIVTLVLTGNPKCTIDLDLQYGRFNKLFVLVRMRITTIVMTKKQ